MDNSHIRVNEDVETITVSRTEVIVQTAEDVEEQPVLRLRLQKPKTDRKVSWREETVDNENMNRKKSKCCCIYRKPLEFGESSSESDEDECEHCFGHVEKRKKKRGGHPHSHDHPENDDNDETDKSHEKGPADQSTSSHQSNANGVS